MVEHACEHSGHGNHGGSKDGDRHWGQTRERGLVSLSLGFKALDHRELLNQQYVLFGKFEKSIWEPMLKAKRIHTNMFTCWAQDLCRDLAGLSRGPS